MLKRKLIDVFCLLAFGGMLVGLAWVELSIGRFPYNPATKNAYAKPQEAGDRIVAEREASATETIARFTIVLAIANAALFGLSLWQFRFVVRADKTARISAIATSTAARASQASVKAMRQTADQQLRHAREIERAYVSGGGWVIADAQPQRFQLTIENAGKTPAIISAYSIFICGRAELPAQPRYLDQGYVRTHWAARIAPGGQTTRVTNRTQIPAVANPIVYGRFWYADIWGGAHFFSFILPLNSPDDHTPIAEASAAYTEWT